MHVALKVIVLVVVLLLGLAAYLYHQRSRAVLYRYAEAGNPVAEPAFSIFNPFRDRSPEQSAEAFLEKLKVGQCEQSLSALPDTPEHRQELCEREKASPLVSWRLTNRSDESTKTRMYYKVKRRTYDGYLGQLWVTLERQGTDWQVTSYECFY